MSNDQFQYIEDAIVSSIMLSDFDNNLLSIDVMNQPIPHHPGYSIAVSAFVYSDDNECFVDIDNLFVSKNQQPVDTKDLNMAELELCIKNRIKKF